MSTTTAAAPAAAAASTSAAAVATAAAPAVPIGVRLVILPEHHDFVLIVLLQRRCRVAHDLVLHEPPLFVGIFLLS